MNLGKRIAERLDQLGWERKDLLDRVDGLSVQSLSNLIRRDSKRSELDERIAEALGVSVLWLVYGTTAEATIQEGSVFQLNRKTKRTLKMDEITEQLQRISDDGLMVALGKIEELADRYPKEPQQTQSS